MVSGSPCAVIVGGSLLARFQCSGTSKPGFQPRATGAAQRRTRRRACASTVANNSAGQPTTPTWQAAARAASGYTPRNPCCRSGAEPWRPRGESVSVATGRTPRLAGADAFGSAQPVTEWASGMVGHHAARLSAGAEGRRGFRHAASTVGQAAPNWPASTSRGTATPARGSRPRPPITPPPRGGAQCPRTRSRKPHTQRPNYASFSTHTEAKPDWPAPRGSEPRAYTESLAGACRGKRLTPSSTLRCSRSGHPRPRRSRNPSRRAATSCRRTASA